MPVSCRDRQRRATARIAVELGQDHAVVADAVQERLRRLHGVLADHGVDDEQDLVRIDRVPDVGGLLHHLLVDAQAAGGVDDHDVVQLVLRLGDAEVGRLDRIADAAARERREHRDARPLAEDLELLDGVRPLEVGRDQQRGVALRLQPERQLAGQCRLTRALQTGQHDHRRRHLGEAQPPRLAAEDLDQFLVNDLDDLLRRVERLGDLGSAGPFPHVGDEVPDHR